VSIDDSQIIDIISTAADGKVVLTLTDHLPWGDNNHIEKLQKKLNVYLAFVESGEVYGKYPDARERQFLFKISCKFQPDTEGLAFLHQAKLIIENAGFEFRHEVSPVSYNN
jgi:hypothetical protein